MAKSVEKQIEEYKKSISDGRKKADKIRKESVKSETWGSGTSGLPVVTDPVASVQRMREAAVQPKDVSMPSQSQIRADAARKRLDRYMKSDERKSWAKKQQDDLYAQSLLTGITDGQWQPEVDQREKQLSDEVKYWENQQAAERDTQRLNEGIAEIEAMSEEDRAAFEKYANKETYVKAEDIEAYKNLKNRYGDRLDHLVTVQERDLNQQRAQTAAEKANARTQSTMGKVLQAPVAVAGNIAGGVMGTAARVNEMVNGTGEFELLDANTLGDLPSIYAQTVQDQTVQGILGDQEMNVRDGVSGRELGALAYQGVMGAAGTGGRLIASGGNAGLAAALAASQSWSSTIRDATAKGASPGQAYALATVNAGIEAATEKLPLDELIKVAKGGSKQASTVIWNILKQAGIEATEEEVSLIGTTLAEAAILQEKSSYNQQVMAAVQQGASLEEARAQANHALLAEAINTALVSGVSGAVSAGGAEIFAARKGATETAQQSANAEIEAGQQQELPEGQEQTVPEAAEGPDPEQDQIAALLEGIREEPQEQKKLDNLDEAMGELFSEKDAENAPTEQEAQQQREESFRALDDSDAPDEKEPSYPGSENMDWGADPFRGRKWAEMGDRKTKAFMHENPEVKEIYQEEAGKMLWDLSDTTRGERSYDEELHYETGGEEGWTGVKRHTSEDIAELRDSGMTYEQIEKGLQAIVEDHGKENNANSKRIEFVINDRLRDGYKDFHTNKRVPPNQEYIDMIDDKMLDEDRKEGFDALMEDADEYAPAEQNAETSTPRADTQRQSLKEGQVKGTGAAERNFSGVAAYEDMLYDGNIQKKRPDAVRDVEMPKKDSDGRHVTEFAGNAVSSGVTTDRMADAIKSLVGDKQLSFDTRTNQQSLENAAHDIQTRGEETVKSELGDHAKNKTIVDGDVEKGMVLYAKYANDPEYQDAASEVFLNLAAVANMSGRNLQLFSLMKRMTPEGQLMTVRKNVGRYIDGINKTRSGRKQIVFAPGTENLNAAKAVANKRNVTIDEALEQNFINAKTEEQKKAALDDIYKNVAVQIKPTLGEVWDAWRNLAMLGNIKTHERNAGSTAAFQPYAMVKRNIGAVLEKVFLKQEARTKSVITGPDGWAILRWAEQDAQKKDIKKLLGGSSTAGDDTRNAIQDNRKILPGLLDTARKKNMDLMEAEDSFFKRREYARSLASFLKARGYAANQLQNNQVPKGVLDEARQYAVKEAQKATFNDQNKLSDSISKLNNLGERFGGSAYHIISKGAVPFLRTPLNVVKRAAEYNPISMANTLFHAKGDINSGRKSASDVIDEVSAGLTGTAAMALGAALAAGLVPGVELVGAIDDEDELREGAQEYSIRIGDEYYGAAWLAPAMIPLFIGANLYKQFSSLDEGADGWDMVQALVDVGTDALDPMLELSMLSSLSDIIEKVKYEDSAADMAVAAFLNAVTSYFTQGIPTVFGQIEQTTETEKSTTYVNTDNKTERMVKTAVSGATKRLPGDLYQTTKLDEWGEPVKNEGDWMERAFNAVLNPFSVSTRKTDDITKELSRLNDAQTEDVTPPTAAKTLSYTDKQGNVHKDIRLTEEQYQTLAQTQGQTAKRILKDMIGSKDYAALTDEQKAKAIQQAYSYARETAEIAAIGDSHTGYEDAWMMELTEDGEARYILRRVASGELSGAMDALNTAWDKGYNDTGRSNELQWAYDTFKNLSLSARNEVKEWATGTTAKYIEAREKGVSHTAFVNAAENISKVKGTGSNGSIRDIDRREAIATTRGLSEKNIDAIMKCYMEDYDPENGKTATTELKYDYIRQELGLSPKQYAQTYRAYLDNSKKADKIAAMMELGYDKKTATALYNVYDGNSKGKAAYMSLYED